MFLISQKQTTKEITDICYSIHLLEDCYLKSLGLQSRRNSKYVFSRLSLEKNKMEGF